MTSTTLSMKRLEQHFDAEAFLGEAGEGKARLAYRKNQIIFLQGDPATAVFYIRQGKVKLTVVSSQGKDAVVGLLREGDFFGEGCLGSETVRTASASALTDCQIVRLEKATMTRVLREQPAFAATFISYLVTLNMRMRDDLVDQIFNSSEKRLARVLLSLANFGHDDTAKAVLPLISQETLAQKVGTTRSRICFFMNEFRKRGFIDYGSGLEVHGSLFNVLRHESQQAEAPARARHKRAHSR
jgi:CRP-like cAMP-binding protein